MERHLLEAETRRRHLPDELRREVQPGRRRRHRPLEFRVDGLVARVVDLLALAVEVGRNGDAAQMFEQLAESQRCRPLEAHRAFAALVARLPSPQLLGAALVVEADRDAALFPFLDVAHDARPFAHAGRRERPLVVGRDAGLQAEDFDPGPRGFVHDQPGADHLGVVEDQQLAGGQRPGDVAEAAFGQLAAAPYQQLGIAPLRQRKLGDALLGQVVAVVVDRYVSFHNCHVSCSKITTFFVSLTPLKILPPGKVHLSLFNFHLIFVSSQRYKALKPK